MAIVYTDALTGITWEQHEGRFFIGGGAQRPSAEKHGALLWGCAEVGLATDTESDAVIGFINALRDDA